MTIQETIQAISLKTDAERLQEAKATLHYLLVEQLAVSSSSADGVAIQRQISELQKYITWLEGKVSDSGDSEYSSIWQVRIPL